MFWYEHSHQCVCARTESPSCFRKHLINRHAQSELCQLTETPPTQGTLGDVRSAAFVYLLSHAMLSLKARRPFSNLATQDKKFIRLAVLLSGRQHISRSFGFTDTKSLNWVPASLGLGEVRKHFCLTLTNSPRVRPEVLMGGC